MKRFILSVVLLLSLPLLASACACEGQIALLDHISTNWFQDNGLIWVGEPTDEIIVADADAGIIGRKFLVIEVLYGEISHYQTNPHFINTDEYIWVISENEEFCYQSTVGFEDHYLFATAYNPCFNFWSYSISNCIEDVIPYDEGLTGYIFESYDPDTDPNGPPIYTITMEDFAEFIDENLGAGELALSLELINFSLKESADYTEIFWQTASERENEYFELQKSTDGRNFEVLTTIDGALNSNTIQAYAIKDFENVEQSSYYRLKWVDTQGKEAFSDIIVKKGHSLENIVHIYPNPVADYLHIDLEVVEENAETAIKVYDIGGQLLFMNLLDRNKSFIDFSNFPSGLYFIEIKVGDSIISRKISK